MFNGIRRDRELGWAPYVWLGYLVFYIAALVLPPATPLQWAASLVGLAVFLPLYFAGFRAGGGRLLLIAWAIFGIGAALAPLNGGAGCFFIYAVAFVPFTGRATVTPWWMGAMIACIALESWALHWPIDAWLPILIVSAVVGITNLYFSEIRRHGDRLRVAQEAVEEMARIAERERIGRDLHDLLGHTLAVIVLKSELASRLADRDPVRAIAEIRDVERISRSAMAEVRKAVSGYRSEGVHDEVSNAERVLVAAGVHPVIDVARVTLLPEEDRALAFALREAVTNVIRHSEATHCWITLQAGSGRAVLEVRDDGRGGLAPEGSGLSGMRERLHQVAGTVERQGREGTRLLMTLPRSTSAPGATA